jgi:hypothetical protein
MKGQTIHQNVFPADEFRHQYAIPEFDVLTVLTFFSRESFNGHTTLRNDIVTQRDHAESTDCITS